MTGFQSGRRTADSIVFGSWRGGGFSNVYRLDLDTGSTERLTDSPDMQLPTSITPDGTTVIFHSFTKSLQALRLDGSGDPMTLVETPGRRAQRRAVSGRTLAGVRGRKRVALQASSTSMCGRSPTSTARLWQVTSEGGAFPLWSRDGRELITSRSTGRWSPCRSRRRPPPGKREVRRRSSAGPTLSETAVSDDKMTSLQTADF